MGTTDQHLLDVLDEHREEIKKKFSVKSLAVFGSVLRGTAGPDSDIDILVQYQQVPGLFGFLDLKQYLESIVGRPVDLVTENALKRQLRDRIIREAVRVA
ncbi:MAG: nucleotidyltransferase family protein [Chloroflexota bacterium]|nr:nucleotidyltransferase family protein [Chloroflexota bacterium]